ncbi:MAG: DNA polymerase III subunit gamma/tau [Armatimonadetes bacterium]|nr:DNA polymerase III subunit gamma/tau [Armatimonadota bacterium]
MAQLALYRKYRSQTFEDLIGQDHVVRTIQNALNSGRTAQTFLFTGPRGTGKTSSARLLAKALNCEKGPSGTPCNECEQCVMITNGSHPDVIEMDAASDSGVDDVRDKIVDVVSYAPMVGRYKVFIIDEVHDLSPKAFDALLKTVEEPPAHLVFILATTEYNKVPATIRSRCQKYEFHRASLKNLIDRLNYVCQQEGVTAEPAAIAAIARMADGGFRDALTLLEQAIIVSEGQISVDLVYDQLGLVSEQSVDDLLIAVQIGDVPKIITLLEEIIRTGRDPRSLLESMLHRLADLTRAIYQVPGEGVDAVRESSLHEIAARLGKPFLIQVRAALAEAHKIIRDISLPKLWLESELIRIATAGTQPESVRAAPVREEPKPMPREAAPREVRAVVETPPVETAPPVEAAPVSEPAPAPSSGNGRPENNDWDRLWNSLPINPNTGKPTMHKLKLDAASLIEDSGERMVVAIHRQIDFEWFNENAQRIKFVTDQLAAIGREGTKLEFILEKKNNHKLIESEAVELHVEGARLERLVKEVFNLSDNKEEDLS